MIMASNWGDVMKTGLIAILASLALAGCANLNSIHQTANLPDGRSHLIDAKQRAIMVWTLSKPHTVTTLNDTGRPGDIRTRMQIEDRYSRIIACAEPSPDAFSVLATSGEFSITGQTGAAAAGSLASTESGASLVRRTTTIQALRDAYFRLCEAHANGAIDDIDLMVGQRHNQTMLLGMLAIEQLTGAMAAPAVAIGGSAQAVSASSMQAIAAAYSAELKKKAGLEKTVEDARTARDAAKAAIEAHDKTKPTEPPEKVKGWEEEAAKLKAAQTKAEGTLKDAEADAKVNGDLIAAYAKMLQNASETGSMAQSAVPVIFPGSSTGAGTSTQADIAKTVESIVKMVGDTDFGPTVCLRYLREKPSDTMSKCNAMIEQYIANLQADATIKQTLLSKLAETDLSGASPDDLNKFSEIWDRLRNDIKYLMLDNFSPQRPDADPAGLKNGKM